MVNFLQGVKLPNALCGKENPIKTGKMVSWLCPALLLKRQYLRL